MLPSKKIQDLSQVSHPDLHYIFVNNRPIKHKSLEKVIHIKNIDIIISHI